MENPALRPVGHSREQSRIDRKGPKGPGCSPIIGAGNGFQVRQASVPLYKNGKLVGGVGCSGDGDQQEDIVVGFASAGFEADPAIRSDRVFLRGNIRLPWLKYPRHPNL